MNRNPFLLAVLTLIPLLFSCKNGEFEGPVVTVTPQHRLFYAEIEETQSSTRVYMDADFLVYWNAADKISIFQLSNLNNCYEFQGNDGDRSGTFAYVSAPDASATGLSGFYGVYPWRESNAMDAEANMYVELPAAQTWHSGTFDPNAQIMVAAGQTPSLHFKNVCGCLGFQFTGTDVNVKSLSVRGNSGELLAGTLKVVPGDVPQSSVLSAGASAQITLTAETPVALDPVTPTFFWLMIPPMTLENGFTLTVTDDQGRTFEKRLDRSISFQRSMATRMGAVELSMAASPLGVYIDGLEPFVYDPSVQQISIYEAEDNAWVRFINPATIKMLEVGPIPVNVTAGDSFNASVSEYDAGAEVSSSPFSMQVQSLSGGVLTLVSGDSRFILRF